MDQSSSQKEPTANYRKKNLVFLRGRRNPRLNSLRKIPPPIISISRKSAWPSIISIAIVLFVTCIGVLLTGAFLVDRSTRYCHGRILCNEDSDLFRFRGSYSDCPSSLYQATKNNYYCSRDVPAMLTTEVKSMLAETCPEINDLSFNLSFVYNLQIFEEKQRLNVKYYYMNRSKKSLWCDIKNIEALEPYTFISYRYEVSIYILQHHKLFSTIAIVALGVILCQIYFRKYKGMNPSDDKRIMHSLVNGIIVELLNKEENYYVEVTCVRDTLIPIHKRKMFEHHWIRAVEHIESSESRIKIEYKYKVGEKIKIWRWVQLPSPKKVRITSQDQMLGSKTTLIKPCKRATPFIIIKDIFIPITEPNAKWKNGLKQAILDKCKNVYEIMEINVDLKSVEGRIFIRFANELTANNACQTFHYWSYEGRLMKAFFIQPTLYNNIFRENK